MATITARATSGSIYNVLDPATWIGGVVPGPNDIAVFPAQSFRTTFNQAASENYNAYTPWTGIKNFITVASTTGFPASGSFYCFPVLLEDTLLPVKINYQSTSSTQFISCSIDNTYREWRYENSHSYTESYPGENPVALGHITYTGNFLYRGYSGSIAITNPFNWQNRYELTGSGIWTVSGIQINHGCDFSMKDSARLILNHSSSVAPSGHIQINGEYAGVRMSDACSFHLTGSINTATGSALSGIYSVNLNNTYLIISGAANYSSSYLASSSAAGTSTLTLTNPDSFGVGDIITVQTIPNITRVVMAKTGSGIETSAVGTSLNRYSVASLYYDYRFGTGSYYGPMYFSIYDTGSYETDDVVQVERISGSVATISRRFGKQGSVQQDLGLFDYKTFTETFDASPEYFTGTRRAVLIDSQHLDYQPGEIVVISGSAATVLYAGTFLSQSQFIDFTNISGNDWTQYLDLDQYMYSGSGYTMTPANTYNPTYRKYTILSTGSRSGRASLFINTASLSNPATPPAAEANVYAMLKNTYFKEGEIEISGSVVRDFVTTASLSTNEDFVGLFTGCIPYYANWAQGSRFSTQNSAADSLYDNSNGFIVNGFDFYTRQHGSARPNRINWPQRYLTSASLDVYSIDGDLIVTPFTGANQSFVAKLEVDRGIQRHYLQGTLMDEFLNAGHQVGMVAISLKRYASIFSVRIKNRYQLVLLDTQDSFNYGDRIKQGGLIDTQQAGKICKFIGNEIEDPMGFQNLVWDYYDKKGQTNLVPYCHSFVYTTSGSVDAGITFAGLNTSGMLFQTQARPLTKQAGPYGKSGTDFYVTYDLGTSSIFDTVGVGYGNGDSNGENTVNRIVSGARIDVADDPDNWTTVWGRQDDTRLSTGGNAIRFYTFPSGSVNKRFIRFFSNGTSGSAGADYNKHNTFGVYCFATASAGAYGTTNTTNQIKLRSVQNFAVGDTIMFWNKEHTGKRTDAWQNTSALLPINYDTINGINTGGATDANTAGGLTEYYTIIAISGSVVTLDKAPAYDHLFVGTTVLKCNRGKINFTGDTRNRTSIYQYGNYITLHIENMNMYNASSNNGTWHGIRNADQSTGYGAAIRNVVEDVFTYSPQRNRNTIAIAPYRMRNVIGKLSNYPGPDPSPYTNTTAIAFNIFNETGGTREFSITKVNKIIHNHIVELCSSPTTTIGTDNVFYNQSFRMGKWYVKNNYWHTLLNDPRSIAVADIRNISEQIAKSFVWDENNFWNGGMINSYGSTTSGAVASLFNQFNLIDYRNLYSAAPMILRKSINNGLTDNVHGTYGATSNLYMGNWFNGMIDTTRLRLDRPKYLRMAHTVSITSFLFDEGDYYSLWIDSPIYDNRTLGNFLTCTFNLKRDADVRIQLNMQARVNLAKKHSIGISATTQTTGENRSYYGMELPKVLFVDIDRNLVLASKLINNVNFQDASINETYNLPAGNYAIVFECGSVTSATSPKLTAQHVLDYTAPTLNILTANVNDIDVYINNWDNYKLLRNTSNNIAYDIYYKDNIGDATVTRTSTNLTTTTRFNKVIL